MRAFPLDPDQLASLDYVIIAEPDAVDVLFGIKRHEPKWIIGADGQWRREPHVKFINDKGYRADFREVALPETLENSHVASRS